MRMQQRLGDLHKGWHGLLQLAESNVPWRQVIQACTPDNRLLIIHVSFSHVTNVKSARQSRAAK